MDTYEKKYKEIVGQIKIAYLYAQTDSTKAVLEKIFPEIKESEDERIKEAIIATIHLYYGEPLEDEAKEMLAWLEKQGEQKPTDKAESKFHEGDWVVISTSDGEKVVQIDSIEYFKSGEPRYITSEGRWFGNGTKAHLWTIQDAKPGDVIFCKGNIKNSNEIKYERICLFNNLDNAFFTLTRTSNYVEEYDINVNIYYPDNTVPATKEQNEILFMAMADAGYTFDFEKKELNKIEQKSADSYCQENCKGFQETGKCFADWDCKAKREAESIDKAEPKFREGQWITNGYYTWKIVEVRPLDYILQTQDGNIVDDTIPHVDEQFHSFTIEDAKDGDILFLDLMGGKTFIYNGTSPNMEILYSFIISNDGKDVLPYHIGKPNTGIGNIEESKNIIYPATKEQRDLLFQKIKEAGYEWDAEKKELKKIEQKSQRMISAEAKEAMYDKPAWSEEDEQHIDSLLKRLEGLCRNEFERTRFAISEDENWLKSFKQRIGG